MVILIWIDRDKILWFFLGKFDVGIEIKFFLVGDGFFGNIYYFFIFWYFGENVNFLIMF